MDWLVEAGTHLVLSFVPLFVAMDAVGNLPILLFLTADAVPRRRSQMVRSAMLTGLGVGLGFVVLGKAVFLLLGIEVADFLVAGGLVLLALSVKDLVGGKLFETPVGAGGDTAGVVPLGTPLVVGPAVLTTLLLLIDQYNALLVVLAFMLNLAFAWLVFNQSDRIARFLGKGGVAATAKIASLLLAAIAVKMIRQGILSG